MNEINILALDDDDEAIELMLSDLQQTLSETGEFRLGYFKVYPDWSSFKEHLEKAGQGEKEFFRPNILLLDHILETPEGKIRVYEQYLEEIINVYPTAIRFGLSGVFRAQQVTKYIKSNQLYDFIEKSDLLDTVEKLKAAIFLVNAKKAILYGE